MVHWITAPDPVTTQSRTQRVGIQMSSDQDSHRETLGLRQSISEAVTLLQERHHIGEAAAFEMMIHGTSDSAEQVQDVATEILDQASHRPPH